MKNCVRGLVGYCVQFMNFSAITSMIQNTVWQSVKGKLVKNRFEIVTVNLELDLNNVVKTLKRYFLRAIVWGLGFRWSP